MIRKIIGILLCCALLFGMVSIGVFATVTTEEMPIPSSDDAEVSNINSGRIDDYEKGTINYSIDDYGLLTISGSGPMSNGGYQFRENKSIKTIVIKQGVTSIGDYVFSGCTGLVSVTIPESVTSIGDGAFYGCTELANITIPYGVTTIGNSAFAGCVGLISVFIPDSVKLIGDYAFSMCTGLASVVISGLETTISSSTFDFCNPIFFGEVDSNIQKFAYENNNVFVEKTLCSLVHAWDNGKVTTKPTEHSKGTKVYTCKICNTKKTEYLFLDEYLVATGEAENSKWFLDKNGALTITGRGNTLPDSFCVGDFNNPGDWYDIIDDVKKLIITGEFEFLEDSEFGSFKKLETIEINGVKILKKELFKDCESLQSVTIGTGVYVIGYQLFFDCTNLRTVNFGCDVKKLYDYLFFGCQHLQSVRFEFGDVYISDNTFLHCGNNLAPTAIIIPEGNTVIGTNAFGESYVTVYFLGDMPELKGEFNTYAAGNIICYYPCGNETWNTRLPRTAEWRVEHPYGAWTNLNDNQHQRVCANDASHTETADHEWNNGEVTKAPTTKAEGEKTYTCIVCGATKTAAIPKSTEEYLPGDVDGNGQVLANDARLALRASAKLEELDKKQLLAADVDGDKRVLANDARQILRYSAKLQRGFEKAVPGTVPTTTLPVTTPMIERTTKALPACVMTNFAAEVFQYINEYRAQYGYMAYTLDAKLCTLASIRCKELMTNFSDMRPDGTDFSTVFGEYGIIYNKCGESILRDNDMDARGAVVELSKNDADNQKIFAPMSDFDRIGVAVLQNGSNYYLVILYSGS